MNENFTQDSYNQENNDNGYKTYAPNNYSGPVVVSNAIPTKSGGLAVGSLVCGIIALVGFWSVIPSAILAIVGVVLGIVNIAKKNPSKGMAIAGIIVSILGFLLSVATGIVYVAAAAMVGTGYM